MIRATEEEVEKIERNYWKRKGGEMLKNWRLYVMLLPLLIFFICWKYLPIGSMIMSFKFYKPVAGLQVYGSSWVGIYWFQALMFGNLSSQFWVVFRNTFTLSFYGLVFGFPFPIILALLFSEIKVTGYRAVAQVLTYLPKFVSTVVITSITILLLRSRLLNDDGSILYVGGPITRLLVSMTGDASINVMMNPRYFRAVYQITGIWETAGYGSIVYFAAILGISPTSYEAARIDGATKMQQIRYVTIPGMTSTLVIMLILQIGQLLTIGYEKVILLQGNNYSILFNTAETVSTWAWHMMQNGVNQAAGAGADMLNSVISMLLVISSNQIARRVSNTSLY